MARRIAVEFCDSVRGDCIGLSGRRGAQRKGHHSYESDGDEQVMS
jgi:hypothetical protein